MSTLRDRRPLTALHALLLGAAAVLAIWLQGSVVGAWAATALIAPKLLFFAFARLDRAQWRHFGLSDASALAISISAGSLLAAVSSWSFGGGMTLQLLATDWLASLVFTLAPRVVWRTRVLAQDRGRYRSPRRVLLYGAGDHGAHALRELRHLPELAYRVVGLIDENPRLQFSSVETIPVLGGISAIPSLKNSHDVNELLAALPLHSLDERLRLLDMADMAGLKLRFMESLPERVRSASGRTDVTALTVERILGPSLVTLPAAVSQGLEHGSFLVIGAGSPLGFELLRLLVAAKAVRVVALDRSPELLGQARDRLGPASGAAVEFGLDRGDYRPAADRFDMVLLALPDPDEALAEMDPAAAVAAYALEPLYWAQRARDAGSPRFALASHIKASPAGNAFGAAMRAGELAVAVLAAPSFAASAVRLAAPLADDCGLFASLRRQIGAGGPVQIADPEQSLVFTSAKSAATQWLTGAATNAPGTVWEPPRNQPIRVADLARAMIHAAGGDPDFDIRLSYRGLLAGESSDAPCVAESRGEHALALADLTSLTAGEALDGLEELGRSVAAGDDEGCIAALHRIVPSYQPAEALLSPAAEASTAGLRRALAPEPAAAPPHPAPTRR